LIDDLPSGYHELLFFRAVINKQTEINFKNIRILALKGWLISGYISLILASKMSLPVHFTG